MVKGSNELKEIKGIGPKKIEKFKEMGINTITQAYMLTKREIIQIIGSKDSGEEIWRRIYNYVKENEEVLVKKADENNGEEIIHLSSGSGELDKALDKSGLGFQSNIILAYGTAGMGKTVWAHTLTVEMSRLGYATLYVNSPNEKPVDFNILTQIADARGVDVEKLKVFKLTPPTSDHLIAYLQDRLPILYHEKNVRLIIIDSLSGFFREEYDGREELNPRTQQAISLFRIFQPYTNNMFIYLVGHEMPNPNLYAGPMIVGVPTIVKHFAKYIIQIRKQPRSKISKRVQFPDNCRAFYLEQTINMPTIQVPVMLGKRGVQDVE